MLVRHPRSQKTESEIASQVLNWFEAAWDPSLSLLAWRDRLVESGWAVPSWSKDWYGQDLPAWTDRVAHSAIRSAGGVAVPVGGGMGLAAPTMYEYGSDDVRQRLLRKTLTGELTWCQLFSEPEAGSDLAGLKTTAVRDDDDWVLNGQKVWNTSADHADMAIVVARTDWHAVKHAGLTYFALDMNQAGVEARPIRQMNDYRSFNEVFLTDARVRHADVIGLVGDGWRVARATLAHERSFSTLRRTDIHPDATGRVVEEAEVEAQEYLKTYDWYPQRAGRADLIAQRASANGLNNDKVVRQKAMKVYSLRQASEWTSLRAKAGRELGKPPGSEGSIGKLALSEVARQSNATHTSIAGAHGMLNKSDDQVHSVIASVLVSTPAQSIAGGTDEIQHNIIGEHVLGLPREPAVDRNAPFNEVGKQ